MKKEIRAVNDAGTQVRITTTNERWYAKVDSEDSTGLPTFKYFPSVTWIVSVYPKLGLQKLRDEVGADEAELLKKLGGERGSKVHEAISAIIKGEEVRVDSKFTNPTSGQPEELTAEEVRCIAAFIDWKNQVNPKFLAWDITLYSDLHGYAGTLDAIAEIDGKVFLIDFKTSKVIGTEYEMQVSAYREAIMNGENPLMSVSNVLNTLGDDEMHLAILQLGTKPLKTLPNEWRWKEVENKFDLFKATRAIWSDVYETQIKDMKGCSEKDYPVILSPGTSVEEALSVVPEVKKSKAKK